MIHLLCRCCSHAHAELEKFGEPRNFRQGSCRLAPNKERLRTARQTSPLRASSLETFFLHQRDLAGQLLVSSTSANYRARCPRYNYLHYSLSSPTVPRLTLALFHLAKQQLTRLFHLTESVIGIVSKSASYLPSASVPLLTHATCLSHPASHPLVPLRQLESLSRKLSQYSV